jgi:zinc transporter 2
MNIRAAIIHLLGDNIQSIGVITASVIIYVRPDYHLADPICTFLFAFLTLLTTVGVFRDCLNILMESSPPDVDMAKCFKDLVNLDGVDDIHDLHIWSLTTGKNVMMAHVRSSEPKKVTKSITTLLKEKYEIYHVTLQVEDSINEPGVEHGCDYDTDDDCNEAK